MNVCKFNDFRSGDLFCSNLVFETTCVQAEKTRCDKYTLGINAGDELTLTKGIYTYTIPKNSIFFIEKNTEFTITPKTKPEYLYVNFHSRRADELVERIGFSKDFCVFEADAAASRFAFDCLEKANEENVDLLSEAILLYLFAHLERRKKVSSPLLSKILTVTHENYTNHTFSLASLSQLIGYDPKYISFFFKKNKGIGFNTYLKSLRLKHSLFLIEQGLVSVKSIAFLSGFSDALYFSKVFKEEEGVSPKKYIEEKEKAQ